MSIFELIFQNFKKFYKFFQNESFNGIANKILFDPLYSNSDYKSSTYLRSSINNHFWYGTLSTLNYNPTDKTSISAGIDLRSYKGEHYREVYDLLGGDYAIDDMIPIDENGAKYVFVIARIQ